MDFNNLSSRIRYLRSVLGLSQSEFSQKIGRTPSFIAQIEGGKSSISEDTASLICRAYHVVPNWLQNGTGDIFESGYETLPPDRNGIPNRVKSVREELHLTQIEFAREIDTSRSQLSSVETGRVNPSNEWLDKITLRFGVSPRWLRSGEGERYEKKTKLHSSMEQIYQFLENDEQARSVVMEAIAAYKTGKDRGIWQKIQDSLDK